MNIDHFSHCSDQFNITHNFAKQHVGLFTLNISKVDAFTVEHCLSSINNRAIGRIKNALV